MTNRDVLKLALSLLAESDAGDQASDYVARAPILLRLVYSELAAVNGTLGLGGQPASATPYETRPEAPCPLSEELAPCAAYYLASLLVLEEAPETATLLYQRYRDRVASAGGDAVGGVWRLGQTVNRYF